MWGFPTGLQKGFEVWWIDIFAVILCANVVICCRSTFYGGSA
jgi:hypothetical protein